MKILSDLGGDDRELFELMLAEPACPIKDIAERFGVSQSSVYNYARDEYPELFHGRRCFRLTYGSPRGPLPHEKRLNDLKAMLMNPKITLDQAARAYGTTKQRIHQILKTRWPDLERARKEARRQ